MIQEENKLSTKVKESDVLHSSRFFKAIVIPFSINFIELILEIAKHIDFEKKTMLDSKGQVITYLSKEGVEVEMDWSNQGVIFTQKDVDKMFDDYNVKQESSNFISSLLKIEHHGMAHQSVTKAQRCFFQDIMNKIINLLCQILGKY